MLPVSGPASESLSADVTVVRPVAGVGHHVLLKSMILREGFATFLAHEALSALVLQQDVLIEILLCDHAPLADFALVLGLEVRPLLVHVEGITVRTSLAANVANYRVLLVLETHVQPHVTFHLELLTAIFALELVLGAVFAIQMLLQSTSALTLESASVARVFLRFYDSRSSAYSLAPLPFDRAPFHGMFPAEMRLKGRLISVLIVAVIAMIRRQRIIYVFLLRMHRILMILQHLHRREANFALVANVDLVLVTGLILVCYRNFVHRQCGVLVLYSYNVNIVRRVRVYIVIIYNREGIFRIITVVFNFVLFLIASIHFNLSFLFHWKKGIIETSF